MDCAAAPYLMSEDNGGKIHPDDALQDVKKPLLISQDEMSADGRPAEIQEEQSLRHSDATSSVSTALAARLTGRRVENGGRPAQVGQGG